MNQTAGLTPIQQDWMEPKSLSWGCFAPTSLDSLAAHGLGLRAQTSLIHTTAMRWEQILHYCWWLGKEISDGFLVAPPGCPLPPSALENTVLNSLLIYIKTKWEGSSSGYNTNSSTVGSLSLSSLAVVFLDLISWKVELTSVLWIYFSKLLSTEMHLK